MADTRCGILLAAGLGLRLRPLTLVRPKALIPLYGIPLIEIGIRQLKAAGCTIIGVNTHHLASQLEAWLHQHSERLGVKLVCFREERLLGTGGGLARMFAELPAGPCIVQNADVLHGFDLESLGFLSGQSELGMLCHGKPDVLTISDGQVVSIGREQTASVGFTGISWWSPQARADLVAQGSRHLVDFWRSWMAGGGIIRACCPDPAEALWEDFGHAHRYLALHRELWQSNTLQGLFRSLGLYPVWEPRMERCCPPGSRIPDTARSTIAWNDVEWRGDLQGAILCDGVKGHGTVKDEIIL